MKGYQNELKNYMWGYQPHFRISCQTRAEAVFEHFDRGLNPKVFLLGLNKANPIGVDLICFEEESMDVLRNTLNHLMERIKEIEENDPDKDMLYSGPGMQEVMDVRRKNNYFKLSIEQLLNESEHGIDKVFFTSEHALIDKHYVFVILALNKEIYDTNNHLKINTFNDNYKISTSILHTSVANFLQDCHTNLLLPEPGYKSRDLTKSTFDIRRQAAVDFMITVSSKGKDGMGLHGLFEACENISIHRYEGEENLGQIFITDKEHFHLEFLLRLEEPFPLRDFRKTRKILQLTGGEVGLICNSNLVLGLGRIRSEYNSSSESIFIIKFNGIHCWEVNNVDQPLLLMKYGQPYVFRELISKPKFYSDCERIFGKLEVDQKDNLYRLVTSVTKQKKGALLIITADPATEAKRLSKQCIPIKPLYLTKETILNLTSIDGGVLIDVNGIAYAQGVILDGIVGDKGNSARGSRYNSAVTYYEYKGKQIPTLIIVVSEDGMVDILPFLRPQIDRAEIPNMLILLKNSQDENDYKTFNQIMGWLKSRSFYLSKEQCSEINGIKNEMGSRKIETIRIVHDDLLPNKEMDDSYFI